MTIGAFMVGVIGEPRVGVALPVGEAIVGEREEVEGEKGEDGEDGANESAARRCTAFKTIRAVIAGGRD